MKRHTHRFVATPITGRASTGQEVMFGWRVECEHCGRRPQAGDIVEEIKTSWWKEIKPENELVSIEYK